MVKVYKNRHDTKRFGKGNYAKVMARDKVCVGCGKKTKLLVHHIDGVGRDSVKPNNKLNNLVVLCKSCHRKIHAIKIGEWAMGVIAKYWDDPRKAVDELGVCRRTVEKYRKLIAENIGNGTSPFYCKSRVIKGLNIKLLNRRAAEGRVNGTVEAS